MKTVAIIQVPKSAATFTHFHRASACHRHRLRAADRSSRSSSDARQAFLPILRDTHEIARTQLQRGAPIDFEALRRIEGQRRRIAALADCETLTAFPPLSVLHELHDFAALIARQVAPLSLCPMHVLEHSDAMRRFPEMTFMDELGPDCCRDLVLLPVCRGYD